MADQNRTAIDWEDVRLFAALARHGSLSGAARALSVNHATVARRVKSLETTIGERLVERRPDGYVLTRRGARMLDAANDMEAAAARLGHRGTSGAPTGLVRINAPPSLSQNFLVHRLARLSRQQPGLDIDLATDFRTVSLERREADIALRFGRPEDGDVIARRLVSMGFGFYATADCRRRIDAGDEPVFVGFDEANAHLPEALWLFRKFPHARMSFRTSNQAAQAAAAQAGAGIALLPHFIGRAKRKLCACKLAHAPPPRELWLITRRRDRNDPLVGTVARHLADIFANECALFED
ncbi:LysR family transcriptional regulator [Bradyrhizobium sp. BRP56]|nr:LysR family transcriptional regulator [Bradyrhizobium sp. BRP56]